MRIGIGTKILLVVGVVFILFTIGLAALIGATSFNNLTQLKQAELDRTSQILASQIAQLERNAALAALSFDESEPIVTEIQALTNRGPYYADPGSYFEADFVGKGGEIEDADKIYVFQSQLKLLQLLRSIQQLNSFSSITFYQTSPFDIVPNAAPVPALRLAEDQITLTQFQRKGAANLPIIYTIPTDEFVPPAPDYFDISSAYAFPPEDFYRENHFVRADERVAVANFPRMWRDVTEPTAEFVIDAGVPVLNTWYPVHVSMAHPETWEEEVVPVGFVQIEQRLDAEAIRALARQLGLDMALAQDGRLLVTSLPDANVAASDQRLSEAETIVIDQDAFNYAWQAIAFNGVDTGLQAVVLSPVSELAGPTNALRGQIIQLALITVLLAGILIYLTLYYLLNRPLHALMDGVQRISRGNLNHVVSVGSNDEVGQLGVAFNSMAEQLRSLVGSLEQRVEERTQELTAANQAAEIARRKAEDANQAKSEFLSYMSHELRTPLNGILGYAQILRRNGELTSQQANGLAIIQQSGEHLLTLINDILDMTKIEAHKMDLFPTLVDLPAFLETLANIFRLRAHQSGLNFVYQVAPNLPAAVHVDEKRLRQIIINLLSNAIRYTEQGTVTFSVTRLDAGRTNGNGASSSESVSMATLRFSVRDTGVGLSPEAIEDIFLPFERLGESRQRDKGSGLGLAISQNLAHIMESEIKVESVPGAGSVFWFDLTLPVALSASGRPPAHGREITGYQGRRRTILTVDDNLSNRRLITDLLSPLGFQVWEAASGEEAIRIADERRPDLVFMDLRMAGMGGLEATSAIRQAANARTDRAASSLTPVLSDDGSSPRDIVIIAASASAFEKDKAESRVAGCDGFLAKPVQITELFALLERHLGLEWIFAEEGEDAGDGAHSATPSDAEGNEMIPPSADELAVLLRLAQRGMMRGIRERAQHLAELDPKYKPFATQLCDLARQFREKDILALIERHMQP